MRYQLIPVRLSIIKRTTNSQITTVGEKVEKRGPLCVADVIANWYSHCAKQPEASSKKYTINRSTIKSSNLLLVIYPKKIKTNLKDIRTSMFISTLFIIVKIWNEPVSINR